MNAIPIPPTQPDVLRRGFIHAMTAAEEANDGACLSPREVELLSLGFRAGVEAKADEVQPTITSLEFRAAHNQGGVN